MKETPEEKLLRIIESSSPDLKPIQSPRMASSEKNYFKEKNRNAPIFSFKTKAVWGIVLCAVIFVTFFLVRGLTKSVGSASLPVLTPNDVLLKESDEKKSLTTPKKEDVPQVSAIKEAALAPQEELILEKKSEIPVVPIENFTKNLRVVGIIWSKAPQVMIEDVTDHRTYLLNQGNALKGVRVKEILKDRVVLSYDNQEVELR